MRKSVKYMSDNYTMNGILFHKYSGNRPRCTYMESSLKPCKQCSEVVRKAKISLNSISRAFHFREGFFSEIISYIYVRPHLEYATPFWNPWSIGDL